METNHPLLEDLCAVLLGEADAVTRERVTRALVEDPALAALEQRLRATLDLVTGAGLEPEQLPAREREALLSAARGLAAPAPAPLGGLLRAAAAVVCLAGGVWFALESGPSGPAIEWVEDDPSAVAAARARVVLLEQVRRLRSAPFDLAGVPDPERVAAYAALAEEARAETGPADFGLSHGERESLAALGYGAEGSGSPFDSRAANGVVGIGGGAGGAGGPGKTAAGRYGARGGAVRKVESAAGAPTTQTLSLGVPSGGLVAGTAAPATTGSAPPPAGGGGGQGIAAPGPTTPSPPPSTPALSSKGAPSAQPAPAPAAAAPSRAPVSRSRGGAYRGVGDTVPPRADAPALGLRFRRGRAAEKVAQDAEVADHLYFLGDADLDGAEGVWFAQEPGVRRTVQLPPFEAALDVRERELARTTRILPGTDLSERFSRWWGDNPWELTLADAQATFAADVDTASFGRARYDLGRGRLPGRSEVRTEEFVNWFQADLDAPVQDALRLSAELAPTAVGTNGDRWLLRVGVRAKEVPPSERDPLDLVLVVDVSGSMNNGDRMGLVKRAVGQLVEQLDGRDTVAVVTFNAQASEVLPPTSAAQRGLVRAAMEPLSPGGGTNAAVGLQLGYQVAARTLAPDRTSRVVLLSDGIANTGETDQVKILESVRAELDRGVHLNTIGVGLEQNGDAFLEQLADKGDGVCDYAQDDATLQRALVERFAGAFVPVADDVKIQVEFAPGQVVRWRQLGYENRAIADADFRNDAVDAGEIGSGHQVTALFEIELARGLVFDGTPLATARLRWKEPKVGGVDNTQRTATERSLEVLAYDAVDSPRATSGGYRRAAVAARFAELLRRSVHSREDRAEDLLRAAEALLQDPAVGRDADTTELVALIRRATELGLQPAQEENPVQRAQDDLRMIEHLCGQVDSLPGGAGSAAAWELGAARRTARERLAAALEWEEAAAREAAGWSRSGTTLLGEVGSERSPDSRD